MKRPVLITVCILLIIAGIVTNSITRITHGELVYYSTFLLFIIPIVYLLILLFKTENSISKITEAGYAILKGSFNLNLPKFKSNYLNELSQTIFQIKNNLKRSTDFAVKIGEGNLTYEVEEQDENDILLNSLDDMRHRLQTLSEEEEKRNWGVKGQALFGEILRDNLNDLDNLCRMVIINLVKYLNCNQGGIYVVNTDPETGEKYLDLMASYAYEREKFMHQRIEWGEGLIGQCVLEGEAIYMDEVPDTYVKITSGLGKSTPTAILISPLKLNDEIFGVIEIASFDVFPDFQRQFVEEVGESIASTLSSAKMGENTKKLLEESKQNNEILKGKEMEMKDIQNELSRKLGEIEEQKIRSQSLVDAVNKTNASIEFDMEGTITDANDMFLSVMGYSRDTIIGRHENILIPDEERGSPGYQMMWESLKGGSFFSGEFKRVNTRGDDVWLNGTYNPVFDSEGNVYKVIKFALFTTDEKERELQVSGRINAIKSSVPIIEIKPDLKIKTTNDILNKFLGYKRLELRKMTFMDVLDFKFSKSPEEQELTNKFSTPNSFEYTLKFKNKKGDFKYFLCNFSPIINLKGQLDVFMGILIDVTDQVMLEENLKQQLEAEKQKNAFGSSYNEDNEKVTHQFEAILGELSSGDVNIDDLLNNDTLPIVIVHNNLSVIKSSNQARVIFNMDEYTLNSKTINDLIFFDGDDMKNKVQSFVAEGGVYQDHFLIIPQDQPEQEYVILIAPVFDNSELNSALIFLKV